MQPRLKPYDQQFERIKLEAASARREAQFAEVEQNYQARLKRIEELNYTDMFLKEQILSAAAYNYKEAWGIVHRREERDAFKLTHPYFFCKDYEQIPDLDVSQAQFHIQATHPDSAAYLQTAFIPYGEGQEAFTSWGMTYAAYQDKLPSIVSMYGHTYLASADFTPKPIYNPVTKRRKSRRKKECTVCTHSILLDIDYREIPTLNGKPAEEVVQLMRSDGMFDTLEPSYFICTSQGGGLYIVYLLDEEYLTGYRDFSQRQKAIARYENLLKVHLIPAFAPYGADSACCDISRVFRLPDTYNQKSDTWVSILDFDSIKSKPPVRHAFADIEALAASLPHAAPPEPVPVKPATPPEPTEADEPPAQEPAPAERITAPVDSDLAALALARCTDLETLIQLRRGAMKGKRNLFLHIYATQYRLLERGHDALYSRLEKVNGMFCYPLEPDELERIASGVAYSYTDASIISNLAITSGELAHFQRIGHADPERKKANNRERNRRKRRNQDGVLLSLLSRAERDQQIFALHAQGQTYRQISQALGCSLGTISKTIQRGAA